MPGPHFGPGRRPLAELTGGATGCSGAMRWVPGLKARTGVVIQGMDIVNQTIPVLLDPPSVATDCFRARRDGHRASNNAAWANNAASRGHNEKSLPRP